MATDSIPIISIPPTAAGNHRRHSAISRPGAISDYWALTKPEVNFLIVIVTFTGFYLAFPGPLVRFPWLLLVHTLLGTLLVASGTGMLNQYIERRFDAQMRRTARRPLAAGRLKPSVVLWFGMALSAMGSIYLALAVNALASVHQNVVCRKSQLPVKLPVSLCCSIISVYGRPRMNIRLGRIHQRRSIRDSIPVVHVAKCCPWRQRILRPCRTHRPYPHFLPGTPSELTLDQASLV
jgi:hypothetical protein